MADKIRLTCTDCGQTNQLPADKTASAPKCAVCGHALIEAKPAAMDFKTLEKASKSDDLPLLVDFWAPWCGPCRAMAPEFERAARSMSPKVRFAKIDTQEHPQASTRFGIRGIPALILFHRGREIARLAGARPAAEIERFVSASLPLA